MLSFIVIVKVVQLKKYSYSFNYFLVLLVTHGSVIDSSAALLELDCVDFDSVAGEGFGGEGFGSNQGSND